jgi:two-component system, NtrC family, response regulator HydG
VTSGPFLAIFELSESFRRVWDDLAGELDLPVVRCEADEPVPARAVAVIVAAGGEEDRALDALATVPRAAGVPLYLVGARSSHRFAVEALRRGGTDYFVFPADLDLLRRTLAGRLESVRARGETPAPASGTDPFATLRGASAALHGVIEQARRVVRHGTVTVLVQGETGTGKELLARAVHDGSPRADGPFVAVNCAAIPGELMESELFGHERGAFTSAHAAKPGLFEEADRGTLFLDEIGHLSLHLQGKLLRALDDRRIRRVGSTQSREVDVRIIAATHVDLGEAARSGTFREDLYYRLNVVTLTLPPLRERGDDVEVLAEHFVQRFAARYQLPAPPLDGDVRAALRRHRWPGNVRELQHAIERALLLSDPDRLDPAHLVTATAAPPRAGEGPIPFPATLDDIQAAAVKAALVQHGGNKTAAARELGISRARLQRLLDRGGE